MNAIPGIFRELFTGRPSPDNDRRPSEYLRNLRNAILSVILVIVALAAAVGSAWLSRTDYLASAVLAGFALLLSLIISVTVVPGLPAEPDSSYLAGKFSVRLPFRVGSI